MGAAIVLSLKIYLLTFVISMAVALLIKGVVLVVSRPKRADAVDATPREDQAIAGEEDIAAVAAAVYAVMGPHRIVHIEPQQRGTAWTVEGRYAHHTSHAVPHQPRHTKK